MDLKKIAQGTRRVYQDNAVEFDNARTKTLFERPWLERFCALIPEGGRVLDLGCGSGEPMARYLIEQGFAVTGIDYAQPLLDLAAARFPSHHWVCQDMRTLSLNEQFDGILGWHSFFHLSEDEQRSVLPVLGEHLSDGGILMLTVAPSAGEATGYIAGEPVYHASLSEAEYRERLQTIDIQVRSFVRNDETCGGSTILLAQKVVEGEKA